MQDHGDDVFTNDDTAVEGSAPAAVAELDAAAAATANATSSERNPADALAEVEATIADTDAVAASEAPALTTPECPVVAVDAAALAEPCSANPEGACDRCLPALVMMIAPALRSIHPPLQTEEAAVEMAVACMPMLVPVLMPVVPNITSLAQCDIVGTFKAMSAANPAMLNP